MKDENLTVDDERKLRRIAAFKQRQNRHIAQDKSPIMKIEP